MNISRSNYESYFLDYFEGRLAPAEKALLLQFIESNPDLKEEFESFEMISLPPQEETFKGKEKLKKGCVTFDNRNDYFIAYAEGDLDAAARKDVEQFVQSDSDLVRELDIFKRLRIAPDYRIVFDNKNRLKKRRVIPFVAIHLQPAFYRIAAAITAAALLFAWYFYSVPGETKIAENAPVTKTETHSIAGKHTLAEKPSAPAPSVTNLPQHTGPSEKLQSPGKDSNNVPAHVPGAAIENPPAIEEPVIPMANNVNPKEVAVPGQTEVAEVPDIPAQNFSDVFTSEDLEEMRSAGKESEKKENKLFNLAAKGVEGLGKVTGTEMALNKESDNVDQTNTVAFRIGNFSFSHTGSK